MPYMRFKYSFCLLALCLHLTQLRAQAPAQASAKTAAVPHPKSPAAALNAKLPPFSGTWVLDNKRSQLGQRIDGESKAIIDYDGKTWVYIHSHQASPADLPDQWQTTLVVNSPKYNTVEGTDIVFHSRIARQGDVMLLSGYGVTVRGQKTRNSVRYTLQDDGNTLIESETTVNMLGPQHNLYVLHREGSPAADK